MSLDPTALLGRDIGPYTLERVLGQGGFAWVFAARGADGHPTAVKLLKPLYSVDPEFTRRFLHEATVAAALHHPNIVEIGEVGAADGFAYFSMAIYPGSLRTLLDREGPLPEPRLHRLAAELAAALTYAHAQGIIHRDVKVDNVLLAADGRAVLTDFGIARGIAGHVTATGPDVTFGTPYYISPEQAQGRPVDERSDLYALGVTLYRAATGDMPFRSSDWFELARMHVEQRPAKPRAHRRELSGRFEQIILRCLAKRPGDRYPSAAALVAEIERAATGEPDAHASARRRRHWALLVVAVVVLGVLVALVMLR